MDRSRTDSRAESEFYIAANADRNHVHLQFFRLKLPDVLRGMNRKVRLIELDCCITELNTNAERAKAFQ